MSTLREDSASKVCNTCGNESNNLYFCSSHHDQSDRNSSINKLKICQFCIGWHLQCNHEVTDEKGLKPLICKTHKMMQHEYCRTCDEVFCWGCVPKHSQHKFGLLDNRASELRTKVFESLSELENKEKLMNVTKASFEGKIEKHEGEQIVIREKLVTELEKIKETALRVIDDNCGMMKEFLKAVEDVVVLQQKLRELLSVSNDHLVSHFKAVEEEVEVIRIASDKMEKQENSELLSCKVDCIVKKLKQLNNSISEDLKSSLFDPCNAFYRPDGTYYRVLTRTGEVLLEDVNFDSSGSLSFTNVRKGKITGEVNHCFSSSNQVKLLVLTSNKVAYLADPSELNLKLTLVSYPTRNNLLWPYYVENRECPDWSHWEGGAIKFSTTSFIVECETIPSVRMGQCPYWPWLFFITSDNTVITADISRKQYARVSILDNDRITCVSCVDYYSLFLFSADGNSFYTAYWVQNYTCLSPPLKHNWANQSNVITVTVNNRNYSITKAANPSDSKNPYIFKVTNA